VRVFELMLQFIAHADGQLDPALLQRFVAAYQTVTAEARRTLGGANHAPAQVHRESPAGHRRFGGARGIATRRIAGRIGWAVVDGIVGTDRRGRRNGAIRLGCSDAFISEFHQRLSRMGPSVQLIRAWLERLAGGLSTEQCLFASQTQAADQVTVSHSISLRRAQDVRLAEVCRGLSVVEHSSGGIGVYARMDATAIAHHRVETLGRFSPCQTRGRATGRCPQPTRRHGIGQA
jgi:hypothetical protein